jgi:TolB-like protein/tetratricopeptide (TPR) repeat protein
MILGTVQYMSPEQARAQTVDNRTDIWALGCVLYEMLTQRCPFAGETFSDVIAALLLKEPQWDLLPQDLPQKVKELLKRCLKKDPDCRVEDVTTLKTEIDKVLTGITVSISRPYRKPRSAKKRIRSLVVLPLTNLSRDPDKEYFADGMTEALISGLAKLGGLRIISRTSAMCYKGTTKSLPEIAQELNVDAVLEGSVNLVGQRVRITAQLISAATDMHLWAEDYDRDLQDVLLLQSEVAQAIASKIQVALTPDDTKRLLGSARPVNPEAYEACLKGRFHLYKVSPEHLVSGLGYFHLALEKDPNYAAAYAGIGEIWLQRCMRGYISSSEAILQAKEALLRALEMDDSAGEVHESLAIYKFFEWDWVGAEKECQRAIQLNNNSAHAHFAYSDFLIHMGRDQQSNEEMTRALDLDPLNSFFQAMWGWHLVFLRRTDDAIKQLRKTLIAEPNFSTAHLGLWGAFYQKRMYDEALEEAKKFFSVINDSEIIQALTSGYAEDGYSGAMRRAAQKLTERSIHVHVPAIRIARLYAHAGAKEEALQWLEKAYEQRELPLIHVNIGWDWDDIRDHPRFQNILHQMKLPA